MIVNPGSKVPLSALLADADGSKYVRAFLYADGAPYSTPVVDLVHVAKGRYEDSSVDMPEKILHVVYQAFLDPGFSALANYYSGADVFQPVRVTEQVHDLEGIIDGGGVIGELQSSILDGSVESAEVSGSVESTGMDGEVETGSLEGEAGEQDVEGEAGC